MAKIEVAVIPAGGFGTRFLPTTKSIPKEMFPLGNKPIILHVVEEIVNAGIKEIIIVTNREKKSLEKFFAEPSSFDACFTSSTNREQARELDRLTSLANIKFVYTGAVCGNAAGLMAAQSLVAGRPFALLWSDEIILSKKKNRLAQCLETYEQYQLPVISAVQIADPNKRKFYGMAELVAWHGRATVKEIKSIIEKPVKGTEPSAYATHGAYILPPDIFEIFKQIRIKPGSELSLPDIIRQILPKQKFLAKIIKDGVYLDCGNPLAYVCSQIEYGLKFGNDAKAIKQFIKQQVK